MTEIEGTAPRVELTDKERVRLERVAAAEAPHTQRAQALLALAEGADLEGAAATADLTVNQVRYWLGRFGTRRLSIFPEELLVGPEPRATADPAPPMLAAPEEAPLLVAPELAGELPKSVPGLSENAVAKKSKKAKKSKQTKKRKSGDKGKKSKKSKKKEDKAQKNKNSKKGEKEKDSKKSKKSKKEAKDKKSKQDKKGKKGKKKKKKK